VEQRPRYSLARVMDDLGATLLHLAAGDVSAAVDVGGIVIHDPIDDAVPPENSIVLGVGIREPADIARLMPELVARRSAALVLRAPVAVDGVVAEAVQTAGIPLIGLTPGASWTQLAAMLRTLLDEGQIGTAEPHTLSGIPAGDLFALANAVAALVDAPVTIEDRGARVLAFSGRQEESDRGRIETILGRQVPERYSRVLEERGVFRDLYRSDDPIQVAPVPIGETAFSQPRAAIAVRAGDEILGSIWAAVREPLSDDRKRALRDAAQVVALHLLRNRAGADVERRLQADLVASALEGGAEAQEAAHRLGLSGHSALVIAVAVGSDERSAVEDAARLATERQRVADAFAVHLSAVHPRSATAQIGNVIYGVLPAIREPAESEERAGKIAEDFLERLGDHLPVMIAVGPVAVDAAALVDSRASADRALRVVTTARPRSRRVVRLADVHAESLLLELRDLVAVRGDRPTGVIAKLIEYDHEHDARLVATLNAWLEAFGDVNQAADAVFVHPNTFRYRLRRLVQVSGIDLKDPADRFAAMLQLRVVCSTAEADVAKTGTRRVRGDE